MFLKVIKLDKLVMISLLFNNDVKIQDGSPKGRSLRLLQTVHIALLTIFEAYSIATNMTK